MLDRVRESLFSVLGEVIQGARVWDLFAGSGSLGLEALSRGALEAVFVERGRPALRVLEANLTLCQGEGGPGRIVVDDAWEPALPGLAPPDLVFLDPPYPQVRSDPHGCRRRIVGLLSRLAPTGTLVFHYDGEDPVAVDLAAGLPGSRRRWGGSGIAFLGGEE